MNRVIGDNPAPQSEAIVTSICRSRIARPRSERRQSYRRASACPARPARAGSVPGTPPSTARQRRHPAPLPAPGGSGTAAVPDAPAGHTRSAPPPRQPVSAANRQECGNRKPFGASPSYRNWCPPVAGTGPANCPAMIPGQPGEHGAKRIVNIVLANWEECRKPGYGR